MVKKLITGCIITLGLSVNLTMAAPVFKIEKGENTVYVGGTMHLLSKTDYPLPAAFKQAYSESQALVFETDLSAMNSPEIQQQSLQMFTYTDGRSLSDTLSAETLTLLQDHLASRQVPFDSFKTMKPGMAGIMLSVIEMNKIGLNSQGVDAYYSTVALGEGKAISWLEEPIEQLQLLAKLGTDNSDEFIQYTLKDLVHLPENINALKSAWRSGDLVKLESIGIAQWAENYPDLYSLMLANRNAKWLTQLHAMLETEPVEFVLVGALHLAGPDGLVNQLKQAGFAVSQLN